jgi:hypothetical protein
MTRAKDDLHLIVPQRFLRTVNMHKATGTSMRQGPVSFPIVCLACSKRRFGRWR